MNSLRHVIVLVLLLAYTGQSLLAVGASCAMNAGPTQEMAGMDHSDHHDMAPATEGGVSCCDGGFCSMSHCQSVAAMPQSETGDRVDCPGSWSHVFLLSSTGLTVDPFFRPPIFH